MPAPKGKGETGDDMTDWYYHDPAQGGRVGPLSAGQMRERYVDRRIQADTLAWHAGVQEWQPLERFAEELALHTVRPDAARPPPLPPPPPPGVASRPGPGVGGAAPPPKRGLSGCAIVAIVAAVAAVPVIAILAAIAVPAYHDYTIRANSTAGIIGAASAMQRAVEEFSQAHGRCPGDNDFAPLLQRFQAQDKGPTVHFGTLAGGNCAFEFTLHGDSAVEGRTLVYEAVRDGDLVDWDCSGGDLPDRYRPVPCRGD
ncbi:pilin [Luteimonas lutimaris]|uniref:Pilin n=2 Tax=Luteimonas lutimaris TaxID=698645 RepID=A0ABP7MIL0_9GAMM